MESLYLATMILTDALFSLTSPNLKFVSLNDKDTFELNK
jgi:hypothetical protein